MSFHKTKEQRRAWWRNLSTEEKSKYVEKWENKTTFKRQPQSEEIKKMRAAIKPLTKKEMKSINATMRKIGLERFIVLPD